MRCLDRDLVGAEVRRYRDPRAGLADGIHAPGLLRMAENPDGTLRRLLPGERQVWDDATVNVGVCIDWPAGGDRCADRYGVRVARYQLLLGIDCATDFCVGYNYVCRGSDAYRAEDVVRSWHRCWSAAGMPDECVVEGGAWQGRRALEYLGAAGVVPVSAKGRPWQKLVEGWFNRLWTKMSLNLPGGQVGRFRGEMRGETADWTACREGRRDPRGLFPDLGEFLAALDLSIAQLNAEPVESAEYGTWVPAEAWAASPRARRGVPAGMWRLTLPVREVRVIRNASVQVSAEDAWGGRSRFTFADRGLTLFEGARAAVSFDPADPAETAVVELAERFADFPAGTLLAGAAAGFVAFWIWESRTASPVMHVELFRGNPVFTFSNLAALANYSATFAVGFLMSLYLQDIEQLTPRQVGWVLLCQPVVQAVFSPLAGRLSDRVEPRILASAGMGFTVTGLAMLARTLTATEKEPSGATMASVTFRQV